MGMAISIEGLAELFCCSTRNRSTNFWKCFDRKIFSYKGQHMLVLLYSLASRVLFFVTEEGGPPIKMFSKLVVNCLKKLSQMFNTLITILIHINIRVQHNYAPTISTGPPITNWCIYIYILLLLLSYILCKCMYFSHLKASKISTQAAVSC